MWRRIAVTTSLVWLAIQPSLCDLGPPQEPIPLSRVLEQLSRDDQVREKVLQSLDALPNAWGLIGPNERARLRDFILNRNWSAIDHFPALTVAQLKTSVGAANVAAQHYSFGGDRLAPPYVEIGNLTVERGADVRFFVTGSEEATTVKPPIKDLGSGLTMGDPPDPELWKWHKQSERTAYLLNRLALNPSLSPKQAVTVSMDGHTSARSPEELVKQLSNSGCDIRVEDARYFANFGHLHYKGQDVLMPFWLNTRLRIPGSKTDLLTPVSHAEEELRIRCSQGNADVTFYYGIDGMAEFRTMDTLDQYWVGKNVAHTFRGEQAGEVMRLLGGTLRLYAELHRKFPDLPFRGYYRLGVCQDAVAAIENKLLRTVTLFPITHDNQYFRGDSEIEKLFSSLPDDRKDRSVSWRRVRGSLPASDLHDIRIPHLRRTLLAFAAKEDLIRNERAIGVPTLLVLSVLLMVVLWWRLRRTPRRQLSES